MTCNTDDKYNRTQLCRLVKIVTKLLPNCPQIISCGFVPASCIVILNVMSAVLFDININGKEHQSCFI